MVKFAAVALIVFLVLLMGCSEQDEVLIATEDETTEIAQIPETGKADWQIDIVNNVPIARFEDGSVVEGWDAYQAKVIAHADTSALEDLFLSVTQWPEMTTEAKLAGWDRSIFGYYVRFSAESGPLRGCIQRTVPHLGILIRNKSTNIMIVNIHVAAWTENGRVCVGIYNSGSRGYFCRTLCSPTYSDIKNALTAAIVAAGVGYVAAYIIASVITPVVVLLIL